MTGVSLALELIAAGVPVVVCTPRPGWKPGDARLDIVTPTGWSVITAAECDVSGFRPGVDTLAMVGGHGVDVVDCDTKAPGFGTLDNMPPFRRFGRTGTPSGGTHDYVRSTGIAKITPLTTSAGHVGDYVGGTPEGGGRLLAFLPGSTRPKYPGVTYTVIESLRLAELLEHDPDDDLMGVLMNHGGNRAGLPGKPSASLTATRTFLAEHSTKPEHRCTYGKSAIAGMLKAATATTPGDPQAGRHGWAVASATRCVELVRAGCAWSADLNLLEATLHQIKPEGGSDWGGILAWAINNADGTSDCGMHNRMPDAGASDDPFGSGVSLPKPQGTTITSPVEIVTKEPHRGQVRMAYPPFKDPEDWRPIVGNSILGERDLKRAQQVAADATADHHEKHATHDHPWCTQCTIRMENAQNVAEGLSPSVSPLQAKAELLDDASPFPDDDTLSHLQGLLDAGDLTSNSDDDTLRTVSDHDNVDELRDWLRYLEATDQWRAQEAQATMNTISRAGRYFLVHGRPPADPGPLDDGADLDDEYLDRDELDNLPLPTWLVDGILPRYAYAIFRGRDHSFKSFAVQDLALCLATGKPWQGHQTDTIRVLYIAGEGAHGVAARVDAWEQAWRIKVPPDMFTIRRSALSLYKPGAAFSHLLRLVEEGKYGLVIIDTLRRVAGSADGNSSEMGAVVDNIDRIKRATHEGTVLVVAHTDKGDNDSRGYSGIEDDADVVWHAKRDEMNLKLENTKMKDGPDGHVLNLHAVKAGNSLVLEAAGAFTVVASGSQIKLLNTLAQVFPDGAHSGQLRAASGLTESTYHRVLGDLKKAGHVTNTGSHKRPFYELAKKDDSQPLPTTETAPDLHNSHDSQPLPHVNGSTPTTPTPLIGGSREPNSTNTNKQEAPTP